MKKTYSILLGLSVFAAAAAPGWSRPERVGQIPNGSKFGCANCHTNPSGGGARTSFGRDIEEEFLASGVVQWNSQLAALDSDGDGQSNGFELQDPSGAWRQGDPQPGNVALVSNPGNPGSISANDSPIFTFKLNQPYPNPAPNAVSFTVDSDVAGLAEIEIFNYSGYKVAEIQSAYLNAGKTVFNWNGRVDGGAPAPNGSYIVSVKFKNISKATYITIYR